MTARPWIDDAATAVLANDLTDVVTITRADPTAATVHPVTGVVTPSITVMWSGMAYVSSARPQRNTSAAGVTGVSDDREIEATHRISLPLEVGIVQAGDQITVEDSQNVDLINGVFDVIDEVEVSSRVRRQVWCRRVRSDVQR